MRTHLITILVAALALAAGIAIAQQLPSTGAPPAPTKSPAKTPAAQPQTQAAAVPAVPHPNQLMILIRSTLLAANQANLTGNYTVLRELGTPSFQQTNNSARLADIFRNLRERKIDLSPIAVLDAKLVRQPVIDAKGRLSITGFFPSRPEQVNFDLLFEKMGDRWRLFGIALNTAPNQQPAATTESQAPQPEPANKNKPDDPATDGVETPATSLPKTKTPAKKATSTTATRPSSVPPDVPNNARGSETSPAQKAKPKSERNYNPLAPY